MIASLDSIPLVCPLDGLPLIPGERRLQCQQKHVYDIARQGYVNLLPVQFKSSRDPGDSKTMVNARRAVMEQGHFSRLGDLLCGLLPQLLCNASPDASLIIDAGCGEGYYSALLAQKAAQPAGQSGWQLLGVDISKWAVQKAAKKYSNMAFAVASNARLPVASGAAQLISSVFGFETWSAWAQLQHRGQRVVVVDAGPRHLIELRQRIYPQLRVHPEPDDAEAIAAGYSRVDRLQLSYQTQINNRQTLENFLEMTPHGRRANPQLLNNLIKSDTMEMTVDAVIRIYRRC